MSYLVSSGEDDFRRHLETMKVFREAHGNLHQSGYIPDLSGRLPFREKFNRLVVPIWRIECPAGSKN
jgi:hypothetical protein